MNLLLFLLALVLFSKLWSLLGSNPEGSQLAKKVVRLHPEDVEIKKDQLYPGFDEGEFLEGAETAFDLILNAYHTGDTQTLKDFVSSDLLKKALQDVPEEVPSKICLAQSEILAKEVKGKRAFVTVRFVSEQVFNGKVRESEDVWVFERSINSEDPNWTLGNIKE